AEKNRNTGEMRDPGNIAVIGVTGYTGFELATLLLRHPSISKPVFYVRDSNGNHCLSQRFPQRRMKFPRNSRQNCSTRDFASSISAAPFVLPAPKHFRPGTSCRLRTRRVS